MAHHLQTQYLPLPARYATWRRRLAQLTCIFPMLYCAIQAHAIGKPVCTIIATPAAVAPGDPSTLTAQCSPAATSFAWTGGSCTGNTSPTCTVTPTQATTYSVAGVNAQGIGVAEVKVQMVYSDAECFFNWAEVQLPNLLTPAHQPTLDGGFVSYRAYAATGVYLGLGGASVLVVGGAFGSNASKVGMLSDYLPAARAAACQ